MITADRARELLDYNPSTGEFLWRHSASQRPQWNAQYGGKPAGSYESHGYRRIKLNYRHYKAHRLAWLMTFGAWPDGEIDHINGDRADNRISNLRDVSPSENARNQQVAKNNTSGVPGLHWCARDSAWIATIRLGDKRKRLGSSQDFFVAACLRKSAENLHGFHPNHGRAAA